MFLWVEALQNESGISPSYTKASFTTVGSVKSFSSILTKSICHLWNTIFLMEICFNLVIGTCLSEEWILTFVIAVLYWQNLQEVCSLISVGMLPYRVLGSAVPEEYLEGGSWDGQGNFWPLSATSCHALGVLGTGGPGQCWGSRILQKLPELQEPGPGVAAHIAEGWWNSSLETGRKIPFPAMSL